MSSIWIASRVEEKGLSVESEERKAWACRSPFGLRNYGSPWRVCTRLEGFMYLGSEWVSFSIAAIGTVYSTTAARFTDPPLDPKHITRVRYPDAMLEDSTPLLVVSAIYAPFLFETRQDSLYYAGNLQSERVCPSRRETTIEPLNSWRSL